jgi:TP901 family phage tail tape measure protein
MIVALGVDSSAFKRGLGQARDELGRFEKMTDRASREAATFAKANTLVTTGLKAAGVAAGAFLGTGFTVALRAAAGSALDFGKAMAEVSTLLDDTSAIPELTASVKALAGEFGKAPVEEVGALYQIISAGATNAAQATQILTAANRLSVAGLTDVKTAADGLTTILNAYGPAAGTAAEVSDAMFVAMKSGKTTIGDLANSISTVAPLAAQAGASLTDILAATSALTKGGVKTEVAMTGLRAVLASIVKPSSESVKLAESLGLAYNAAGLKAKGLGGFLADLKTKTGGNVEVLAQLAGGVEAVGPLLALTGTQAKDFGDILAKMADRAGETSDALAKVAETPAQQFARLKSQIGLVSLELGTRLLRVALPVVTKLNESFATLVGILAAVAKALGFALLTFGAFKALQLGAVIAQFTAGFVSMIAGINGAAGAMQLASFAARAFQAALGPIGLIALGIGALTAFFYKQAQAARAAAQAAEEYAASLSVLSRTQLLNLAANMAKQLDELEAQRTKLQQASIAVQADASRTRQSSTASGQNQQAQIAALTRDIDALKGRLAQVAEAFKTALDPEALQTSLAGIVAGFDQTTGSVQDTTTAMERLQQQVDGTLDTLDIMQERQSTIGDFAGGLARAFDAARVALERVETQITNQASVTGQVDPQLVALANLIRRRMKEAATSAFQPLIDGARDAIQRASLLAESGASQFVQSQALDDLKDRYRAVLEAIAQQGGALQAPLALLQEQLDLVKAIHDHSRDMFGAIDEAALTKAVDRVTALTLAMIDADTQWVSLEDALEGVAGIGDAMLRVADALGGIGDNARQAIAGVIQLADSLRQVQQAKTESGAFDALKALPGVAGAIAAGAQILGGVLGLGESADQRAMKETIQENSKRLKELRDGLDQFQLSANATVGAGRTARGLLTDRDFLRELNTANQQSLFLPGALHPEDLLDARLREMGTNFQQLNAVAKSLGITLETTEGDISIQGLQDLMDAAGLTAASLTRLSQTLDIQSQAANLRARLTGDTGEVAQLQRDFMLFQNFAPQLASAFGGIDAATEEGRERIRKALLHLVDQIQSGGLTPEQLGRFQDADQLLDFIDEFTTALDAIPVKITKFGDTLDQQRSLLDLKAKLFGEDSPAAAIQRELDLLGQFAPQLAQQFQGLDAITAEGRAAIRTALQNLFTQIEQGLLSEEALGKLEGLDQLLSIITNVDTALDSFTDATNAATAALTNIPDGFKLALRRFESTFAEAAFPASGGTMTSPLSPPASPAPMASPPTFDPGRLPSGSTFAFAAGSIVIEGSTKTGDELLDDITAAARRRSLAYYGTTTRAAEVL